MVSIIRTTFWTIYGEILTKKKVGEFFKILSHASNSSFLAGLVVLVIRAAICSCYDKILI